MIQLPNAAPLLHLHYKKLQHYYKKAPPQFLASVLSSLCFRPLGFLRLHQDTGSRSSAQKPNIESRYLYAGHHLPSNKVPGKFFPDHCKKPGFDVIFGPLYTSSVVHFRSPFYLSHDAFSITLTTMTLYHSSLWLFNESS